MIYSNKNIRLFFALYPLDLWLDYRLQSGEIVYLVASVRPSLCLSVCPLPLSCLNHLTYNLDIWYVGRPWPWLACDCRSRIVFSHHRYIALRSRSSSRSKVGVKVKVRVKVKGRGQGQRSRSKVGVKVTGQAQGQISGLGFAECSKEQQPPLPVQGNCLCVGNQ